MACLTVNCLSVYCVRCLNEMYWLFSVSSYDSKPFLRKVIYNFFFFSSYSSSSFFFSFFYFSLFLLFFLFFGIRSVLLFNLCRLQDESPYKFFFCFFNHLLTPIDFRSFSKQSNHLNFGPPVFLFPSHFPRTTFLTAVAASDILNQPTSPL
jgi:hypothetical protein